MDAIVVYRSEESQLKIPGHPDISDERLRTIEAEVGAFILKMDSLDFNVAALMIDRTIIDHMRFFYVGNIEANDAKALFKFYSVDKTKPSFQKHHEVESKNEPA
jgi:hypothetical protein